MIVARYEFANAENMICTPFIASGYARVPIV